MKKLHFSSLKLTIYTLTLMLCVAIASPASAQYYVKKKTPEASEEAQGEKKPFNPFVKMLQRKPATIIKKEKNQPPAEASEPAAQNNQPAVPQVTEEQLTNIRNDITDKMRSTLKERIKQMFGECDKDDKALVNLYNNAMNESAQKAREFITETQNEGTYTKFAEINEEKIRETYEKTGELPEEIQDMMKKQPMESVEIVRAIQQNIDMEQFFGTYISCSDLDKMMEQANIEELLTLNTPQ